MKHVFVDTNVCYDFLSDREPFARHASQLFALAESNKVKLSASSISFTTIDYLARKVMKGADSAELLKLLRSLVQVANVDEHSIDRALASNLPDFEDAVQYYAALSANAEIIVTRNQRDFLKSTLPVQTAEEFLNTFL
ncbi:MAG: PIN domain-containing protein [Owenweeksia sp.]|nr:PIN domain-containing protein [Owenweeksia sp.]